MEASKETSRSLLATTELLQEVLSTTEALARCSATGPWRDGHATALCAVAVTADKFTITEDDIAALFKGVRASMRRLQRGRAGGAAEAPGVADIVGCKTYAGLDAATTVSLDTAAVEFAGYDAEKLQRVVAVVAGRLQARLTIEVHEASLDAVTSTKAAAVAGFANLRGGPGRRSAAKNAQSRALVERTVAGMEESAIKAERWARREAASFRHRVAPLLEEGALKALPLQRVVALSVAAQKAATSLAKEMARHTGRCRAATGFLRANAERDRRHHATYR